MATPTTEHYQGMPQLDPAFMPNLIFWLLVTLVALYFIIARVALPRIAGIVQDRHEAISDDLERAAEWRQRAEEAEAAYNKALADARAEAQAIAAETKAAIQADLADATAKADAEIAARAAESEARIAEIRESALRSIEEVATSTAGDIVEALMPGGSDADAVQAAVTDAMKG